VSDWLLPQFSNDGRIVVWTEIGLTSYQVDPAVEYLTFAHASSGPIAYRHAEIRRDGRVLAAGTSQGIALWDLAHGAELAFLPTGETWRTIFEESGDLLTTGPIGVRRWPVRLDRAQGEFQIGRPRQLPLPVGDCAIDGDRTGQIVALPDHDFAFVATPERTIHVGPLDDCRYVAVSPDGVWLATGSHTTKGAQVWRVGDGTKVAELPVDYGTGVCFSPDGRWLMTTSQSCRLWTVGTWRAARQIGGLGHCFSPDGRLVVVMDANRVIRLVEIESGRTLARLESPDLCEVCSASFSPDGSRLIVTTNDGPAVHVWDLRAIRRTLARMGLDWDAPACSKGDPADRSAPPLPPLKVDLGSRPLSASVDPGANESLISDFEAALASRPDQPSIRARLAHCCNGYAWSLANATGSSRNPERALTLARRAVELAPNCDNVNTLGVAQYRAGQFTAAIATLQKSLALANGDAASDLFFLAMAHCQLGDKPQARTCLQKAVGWMEKNQPADDELLRFRAEAEALLGLESKKD
jgi:hypothetical protein